MPSGYEKSSNYGGPPPGRFSGWALIIIVVGVAVIAFVTR